MAAFLLLINILYATLLVAGGLISLPSGSAGDIPDWVLHGSAYGLQAALLSWLFTSTMRPRRAVFAGVVCATLFGAMVEALQFFQPARTAEPEDLLANAVGACIIGAVIALAVRSRP
jgi:VanZ family protein